MVPASEWTTIEQGLAQRARALNLFIDDVYHARRIVTDGVVPREIIESASSYLPGCRGLDPPQGVWATSPGTDLVRHSDGKYYVLEDNLRCPSGVSYVLHNRQVMKRTFPKVFEASRVRPVDAYPSELLRMLQHVRPRGVASPTVVVLTPGPYNSAYSEHSFLAQQMGVELVEPRDLAVRDGFVWMRTTRGMARVDVIYRRIDDAFIDPTVFRPDSMLGVPGIMNVVRAGRVTLANAPGTGVADDKVIYAYVPAIIKYYLGEEAILPNVPTFVCFDEKQRAHVLANLDKLVVKAANESGGYGMLMGPQASVGRARGVRGPHPQESAQLHRAAAARAVARADARGRRARGTARRLASVHPPRRGYLRAAGRPDARRTEERLVRREFVPGWRKQGHVGPCGHGRRGAADGREDGRRGGGDAESEPGT